MYSSAMCYGSSFPEPLTATSLFTSWQAGCHYELKRRAYTIVFLLEPINMTYKQHKEIFPCV